MNKKIKVIRFLGFFTIAKITTYNTADKKKKAKLTKTQKLQAKINKIEGDN